MTAPASDKHYTARIIERKDLSEDLWLIRVDPGRLAEGFDVRRGLFHTGKGSDCRVAPLDSR